MLSIPSDSLLTKMKAKVLCAKPKPSEKKWYPFEVLNLLERGNCLQFYTPQRKTFMAGSREVTLWSHSTGQRRKSHTGAGDVQIVSWALIQEMKKEQEKKTFYGLKSHTQISYWRLCTLLRKNRKECNNQKRELACEWTGFGCPYVYVYMSVWRNCKPRYKCWC